MPYITLSESECDDYAADFYSGWRLPDPLAEMDWYCGRVFQLHQMSAKSKESSVYCIAEQDEDETGLYGSYVKLGLSGSVEGRRGQLQTGNPRVLFAVASMPGDAAVEADLHDLFTWWRAKGSREWYSSCSLPFVLRAFARPGACVDAETWRRWRERLASFRREHYRHAEAQ